MWKKQYNKQQFRIKRKQHKRFLSIRCVERRQHIVRTFAGPDQLAAVIDTLLPA